MAAAVVLGMLAALPDALLALWLALLTDGVVEGDDTRIRVAAIGLALSAAATWFLRTVSTRVQRKFRDKVTIALEAHVARLQASVPTIAHQEVPEHLDRLSVLRNQVFVLDHMYLSVFSTLGWLLRLGVTVALLASVHPALLLLVVFALPTVGLSGWRPGVERDIEERVAPSRRLSQHLFEVATTAPPGKELRVLGIGASVSDRRRSEWEGWYGPVATARVVTAIWYSIGWAVFGLAFVGAVVFVAEGIDASAAAVVLVVSAGARLSAYLAATVGEIGFLRGIWMDGSRRLAWLEDYSAAHQGAADVPVPERLTEGIRLDGVSFSYPGTDRLALDAVDLDLPAGAVVAIVGENGAGKTTLAKLLCKLYEPSDGRILVDGAELARMPTDEWRARLAGAYQDFHRFELRTRQTVGLGDVPADRRRGGGARSRRPGRCDRRGRAAARGPRHPARAHVARRRRRLVRPVAEAGARPRVHAGAAAPPRARRAHRGARRRDRARPLRALRGRGPGRHRVGPRHHPRLAPLLDGAHGRPHRRPRRRQGRRGRHPRRPHGTRRPVRRALRHPGRRLPVGTVVDGWPEEAAAFEALDDLAP